MPTAAADAAERRQRAAAAAAARAQAASSTSASPQSASPDSHTKAVGISSGTSGPSLERQKKLAEKQELLRQIQEDREAQSLRKPIATTLGESPVAPAGASKLTNGTLTGSPDHVLSEQDVQCPLEALFRQHMVTEPSTGGASSSASAEPESGVFEGNAEEDLDLLFQEGSQGPSGSALLKVRLLDGSVLPVSVSKGDARVQQLQIWLQRKLADNGDWVLLNRSAFPPKELSDEHRKLSEEGLGQGGQLSMQRVAGRGEMRQATHRETLMWRGYHGMGGSDWQEVRNDAHKKYGGDTVPVSPWEIHLGKGEEGKVPGALVGKYTIFDHTGAKHKFQKAGMVIVCHDSTAAAAKQCHALARNLNFMVFSFPLRSYGLAEDPDLSRESQALHGVVQYFVAQSQLLCIQAVVGIGTTCAPAVLEYAGYFGSRAPLTAIVLLPPNIDPNCYAWPGSERKLEGLESKRILGVHAGDENSQAAVKNFQGAIAEHSKVTVEVESKPEDGGEEMRLQVWFSKAAEAVNDCLEGGRRLAAGS